MLEIKEIMQILPHRYPFLMVDKILEVEPGKRAVGMKNVTINEPFFQGHYPGNPIMPGAMMAEAMAQVGGVMMMADKQGERIVPFLAGIEKLRFKRPVVPGDTLLIEVEMIGGRGNMGKVKGNAKVDGKIVAIGEMSFALIPEKA
jgi:3-hydroxyacyl-[acyl-carrier-protein] dehydratase